MIYLLIVNVMCFLRRQKLHVESDFSNQILVFWSSSLMIIHVESDEGSKILLRKRGDCWREENRWGKRVKSEADDCALLKNQVLAMDNFFS